MPWVPSQELVSPKKVENSASRSGCIREKKGDNRNFLGEALFISRFSSGISCFLTNLWHFGMRKRIFSQEKRGTSVSVDSIATVHLVFIPT